MSLSSSNSTSLITFNGGSLRMDDSDPSTKTSLRFGYTFSVPSNCSFVSCKWEYYVDSSDKHTLEASNSLLLNNNNTCISNLVIPDVPQANYETTVYVKAYITYITSDGTTVTRMESDYQNCSVKQAAQSTINHPMASTATKAYAQGIINACSNSQK